MPSIIWLTIGGLYQLAEMVDGFSGLVAILMDLSGLSGLRFAMAPAVNQEGCVPTAPPAPPSAVPSAAMALGQGHWALNATYRPSGVAVWHPMHSTGTGCEQATAGMPQVVS